MIDLLFITFFYIHSCYNGSCNEISLCTDCLKNSCLFCSDSGKCIEIDERETCLKPISQVCVCSLFINCSICAYQKTCKWCSVYNKCITNQSTNCTLDKVNTCLLEQPSSLVLLLVLSLWMLISIFIIIGVIVILKKYVVKEKENEIEIEILNNLTMEQIKKPETDSLNDFIHKSNIKINSVNIPLKMEESMRNMVLKIQPDYFFESDESDELKKNQPL